MNINSQIANLPHLPSYSFGTGGGGYKVATANPIDARQYVKFRKDLINWDGAAVGAPYTGMAVMVLFNEDYGEGHEHETYNENNVLCQYFVLMDHTLHQTRDEVHKGLKDKDGLWVEYAPGEEGYETAAETGEDFYGYMDFNSWVPVGGSGSGSGAGGGASVSNPYSTRTDAQGNTTYWNGDTQVNSQSDWEAAMLAAGVTVDTHGQPTNIMTISHVENTPQGPVTVTKYLVIKVNVPVENAQGVMYANAATPTRLATVNGTDITARVELRWDEWQIGVNSIAIHDDSPVTFLYSDNDGEPVNDARGVPLAYDDVADEEHMVFAPLDFKGTGHYVSYYDASGMIPEYDKVECPKIALNAASLDVPDIREALLWIMENAPDTAIYFSIDDSEG